jgi:hypothetical protein
LLFSSSMFDTLVSVVIRSPNTMSTVPTNWHSAAAAVVVWYTVETRQGPKVKHLHYREAARGWEPKR